MQDRQLKCFQGDFKAEKLVLKFVIGWWCWVEVLRSVQRAGAQPARGHWSPGMDGEFLQADRVLTYLTYQPECNCCITHFILFWTSWWKTWGIQLIQLVFFMMLHSSIYLNIKNIHILTLSTIIILRGLTRTPLLWYCTTLHCFISPFFSTRNCYSCYT